MAGDWCLKSLSTTSSLSSDRFYRGSSRFRLRLILVVTIISLLSLQGAAVALNGADVALYNDSTAPYYKGVWQDGLVAIKNMLTTLDITYEEINYKDINLSNQDFSSLYKIILIPGGYAWYYNYWISKTGKERIRNFVNKGGGYFGICAGAYFAVDRVVWGSKIYDDFVGFNAYGQLTGYDLDLFSGTGTGDEDKIADYYAGSWTMLSFNFSNENPVLSNYKKVPYSEDIIYLGGPYFTPDAGTAVSTLATYAYNGQPGLVSFQYGSGRVILSGPHPEIEEDSDRDGVAIDGEDTMNDKGSDWELSGHILKWLMNSSDSQPLAVPSKQESFSFQPVENFTKSSNPSEARPVGVGTAAAGGSTLNINLGLNKFSGAVDIYFGIYAAALDPVNIYILKPDYTLQALSTGLVSWQSDTAGPLSANLFGEVPVSSLLSGTYDLYLMVTPHNNQDNYYFWSTYFISP